MKRPIPPSFTSRPSKARTTSINCATTWKSSGCPEQETIVNPDELVAQFGADGARLSDVLPGGIRRPGTTAGSKAPALVAGRGKIGCADYARADGRVGHARFAAKPTRTIRKVTQDLDDFSLTRPWPRLWNCAIPYWRQQRAANVNRVAWDEAVDMLLLLLAPFRPTSRRSCGRDAASLIAFTSSPGRSGTKEVARGDGEPCRADQRQNA